MFQTRTREFSRSNVVPGRGYAGGSGLSCALPATWSATPSAPQTTTNVDQVGWLSLIEPPLAGSAPARTRESYCSPYVLLKPLRAFVTTNEPSVWADTLIQKAAPLWTGAGGAAAPASGAWAGATVMA